MHSDDDCVASRNNNTQKTATQTYAIYCGRQGCAVVFLYEVGTDWPTVSRLINEHWHACTNGTDVVAPPYPRSDTYGTQHTPNPPQLAPESWSVEDVNHDKVIAGRRKQNKNEDQRREELENDEYTGNVQPTFVRCRGCHKDICLDKRSKFYSGLWLKHRGKCPGILVLEEEKLTRTERGLDLSNTEQRATATGSFRASGEDSEEGRLIGFSTSNVRSCSDRWEREER
ncbi:hypothetical protein EDB19DRAFT_1911255 [Suillus lakei]|nr:hypothetical protein EDB19DRAFT_1911255 [Suillus lakei]